MTYSTIQKVREKAGIQNLYMRQVMTPVSETGIYQVVNDDAIKIVPNSDNGATVAATSDVIVVDEELTSYGVSSIDIYAGYVVLDDVPDSQDEVYATYASSPIGDKRVYDSLIEANSFINSYLSASYKLPLGVCVPFLSDLETRYAAGAILQSAFGTSATDLAEDGYKMQEEVLVILEKIAKSEIGLVDIEGNTVDVVDSSGGGETDASEDIGRTQGTLFISEDEAFEVRDLDDYRP